MGKNDFSEYDFPDDFFEENEFDSRIEELKAAVKENVKQEIIDKISSLERENEELRVFRDRRDEIVGEYRRAIAQAEEDARRAEDKARHAKLTELLGPYLTEAWKADWRLEQGPKCGKCDENRQVHFVSPCGREMKEECTCAKRTTVFFPRKISLYRLCEYRSGMIEKAYENTSNCEEADLRSMNLIKDGADFAKINTYHDAFETLELCQKYCDWKNSEEEKK